MNKFFLGAGSAMLALCAVTACKEKEATQQQAADHVAGASSTQSNAQPAEAHAKHLKIEHAKIAATTANTAAMFLTITNEGAADKLTHAKAENVKTVEIHETSMEGSVAKMTPVKDVAIEANKTVTFEHGGLHLMLVDLPHGGLKEGQTVKVTLSFEKAGDMVLEVPVVSDTHQGASHGTH